MKFAIRLTKKKLKRIDAAISPHTLTKKMQKKLVKIIPVHLISLSRLM